MKKFKQNGLAILISLALVAGANAQDDTAFTAIPLINFDAFSDPPQNWSVAGDATADFQKPLDLVPVKGTGVVLNDLSKNSRMHLYTKENFEDVELALDFMMSKNSNAGVYLLGRYEVQLLDSWTRLNTASSDVGGIYSRWSEQRGTFEGTPPLMNVARAPGLWQHLEVKFRAPRFDQNGNKTKDAYFEEVLLNDVAVQKAVNVTGPTASSMFNNEVAKGPLVLQGDHGTVAFKNIKYRHLPPSADSLLPYSDHTYWESRNPVIINPGSKNYLLRSFMNFAGRKLTHVISVGSPFEVNFAYDLEQGALIKIWRGQFLDVTRMWVGRGEPQLAVPMGSVINLHDAPSVAVLAYDNSAWPDSVAINDIKLSGYSLDKRKNPTFLYSVKGVVVRDSIACDINGEGIARKISVTNAPENFYCKIISGKNITKLGETLYTVDDKKFYIRIADRFAPVIRTTVDGEAMIAKVSDQEAVEYSIIW